jgi:predicted DCC family thiol-disulfide oxidoreductase YuxK
VQETPTDQPATAAEEPAAGSLPLLIYDGDCGFCVYWARYWQKLTGERVDYRPYQDVAAQYPEITEAEFQRAVQYIAPDGTRASAAEASFLTLSHAPGKALWLALYRHVPGFATVSELAYAFIAAHRSAFYRISLLLWGRNYQPPRYELVSYLFLRGLGLVYLAAFVSFAVQAQGLIGSDGILPLAKFTQNVAGRFGAERYYLAPMVFWLNDSDAAIRGVCWAGALLSLLLLVNVLPRLCLFLLFALYLSLYYAGQVFMSYQWDLFLLEMGFAALLLSFATTPGIFLLRWLMFRFMFSGYGLFAIMTVNRREIVMEGSHDGVEWQEYEFRYKPGDPMRAPPWNIPHQPRLDWQMWFAALDNPQRLRWFWNFLERLLENEPTVTALLEKNPFADKPPTYVRAQFYDYIFAGSDKEESQWWHRRWLGQYFPPAHLRVPAGQ